MVTIEADEEVWRELTLRKDPGDSFNDVLRRVLDLDDAPGAERSERAETPPESAAVSHARDALANWDPENVDSDKARRATVAAVEWLAEQAERQRKSAIVAALAERDATEGYSESTLWEKVVQPGLRELVDAGVVTHGRGSGYAIKEEGE